MHVVGSIIARLGSKRLPFKNLLPFAGKPLVGLGIEILRGARLVDEVVVSTESELIARVARDFGATVLRRPGSLAADETPSIPVFQHILENFPCDVHVNFNISLPRCDPAVIDRAVELAIEKGEALSVPYAAWAQTAYRLSNYGDPWAPETKAFLFEDARAGVLDVHTLDDLLEVYRARQGPIGEW
ncbi:MAG: cytidylyltransferase domain-containing protein [Opitutaceae bacterium]